MDKILQSYRITCFAFILALLLTSCSKTEESIVHSSKVCEFVTINITNSLNEAISDLTINEEIVGNIQSNQTITEICLENVPADSSIDGYPMLHLVGSYQGELKGENFGYCGVGIIMVDSGTFNIEITEVNEYGFSYLNL